MQEPPILIDGTRVLKFAAFNSMVVPTGHRKILVGGEQLDLGTVCGAAITENPVEGGTYLLHCDASWQALAGFHFNSVEDAQAAAECAYVGIAPLWMQFRELGPHELAAVELAHTNLRAWAGAEQAGEARDA